MRVAEVDRHAGGHRDLLMLGHLHPLIPGHRTAQLFRQGVSGVRLISWDDITERHEDPDLDWLNSGAPSTAIFGQAREFLARYAK